MNENLTKIKKLSRRLNSVCVFVLFALPIVNVLAWMFAEHVPEHAIPNALGADAIMGPVTFNIRLIGAVVCMIPVSVAMAAAWELSKLLKLYAQGVVFGAGNVNCYRNIGKILIAGFFIPLVYDPLMSLVLTIHNPPGKRMISIGFGSDDFEGLFAGVLLILIAWVMDRAREIEDENLLTV